MKPDYIQPDSTPVNVEDFLAKEKAKELREAMAEDTRNPLCQKSRARLPEPKAGKEPVTFLSRSKIKMEEMKLRIQQARNLKDAVLAMIFVRPVSPLEVVQLVNQFAGKKVLTGTASAALLALKKKSALGPYMIKVREGQFVRYGVDPSAGLTFADVMKLGNSRPGRARLTAPAQDSVSDGFPTGVIPAPCFGTTKLTSDIDPENWSIGKLIAHCLESDRALSITISFGSKVTK